jgi:hypothetical protein
MRARGGNGRDAERITSRYNDITDAPDDSCPQCGNPLVGYDHSMCSINEDGDER